LSCLFGGQKKPQIPAVRGFSADSGKWASALVTVPVRRKKQKKAPERRLCGRRWQRRLGLEKQGYCEIFIVTK